MSDNIKTSCKACAFAEYLGDTQIGCRHNRLEKFGKNVIDAYDHEKEFFVIQRFCNYYRNTNWGYSVEDKDKVINESRTKFDIFINVNDIKKSDKTSIISVINDVDYYSDKLSINIYHGYESKCQVTDIVVDICRNINKKVSISVCYDNNNFLHQQILKSKATYHINIKQPSIFLPNIFYQIDDYINNELKSIFAIKHNKNILYNNHIYKAIAYSLSETNYDKITNTILLESKKLNDKYMLI